MILTFCCFCSAGASRDVRCDVSLEVLRARSVAEGVGDGRLTIVLGVAVGEGVRVGVGVAAFLTAVGLGVGVGLAGTGVAVGLDVAVGRPVGVAFG